MEEISLHTQYELIFGSHSLNRQINMLLKIIGKCNSPVDYRSAPRVQHRYAVLDGFAPMALDAGSVKDIEAWHALQFFCRTNLEDTRKLAATMLRDIRHQIAGHSLALPDREMAITGPKARCRSTSFHAP